MRKCGSCGYLLLSDGDSCRHCGAALNAAAPVEDKALVGAPSRTDAPPSVWAPRSLPQIAPPAPLRPSALPPVPTGEPWHPPVTIVDAPSGGQSKPRAAIVVVAAIIVLVGGFGYLKLHAQSLPPGTTAFVSGQGIDYTPADNAFRVKLPQAPVESSQPIAVSSYTANLESAIVTTNDYEMGAAMIAFPIVVPSDKVDDVLDASLNGGVSAAKGNLISKTRTTRAGVPAVEARFKAEDGYTAHVLVLLDRSNMYVLFVHAKTGTERLYGALNASFVPRVSR